MFYSLNILDVEKSFLKIVYSHQSKDLLNLHDLIKKIKKLQN